MTRHEIERMREWAQDKIAKGEEPPWAWYQYMKLRETLDAILAGMGAATPLGSPESAQHPGKHLRLVGSSDPPKSAPRHLAGLPVQMPM